MIVGTVHQEAGYSWRDACNAWAVQNGEMEAGVHQVGVGGVEDGQERKDQCKEVDEADRAVSYPRRETC